MSQSVSLVWFRHDLRLADHPALSAAVRAGAVLPVYVWAPEEEGRWPPGGASRWWLHHSLRSLAEQLESLGSRLILRRGPTLETLTELAAETSATSVFWNRRYEPVAIERDARIKAALTSRGLHAESFNGSLLHEPWTVATKQGRPYQVFTPFWKACLATQVDRQPLPTATRLWPPASWPRSLDLEELGLLPQIPWDGAFGKTWHVGAGAAEKNLAQFLRHGLQDYSRARDRIDIVGYSKLSPHFHFGELSPRQAWHAVAPLLEQPALSGGAEHFLRELGWREFAYHLLYHFPATIEQPLRPDFARFPWSNDGEHLRRWERGLTGYPIVDAAMRDLWATGFMPNRARMIVASFLAKDLLIPWQRGAEWFWDTLVDADLASNTLGWQWTAGCGADAAPYFRIFNPTSQAEKFDPDGDYIRRWIPELAKLPAKALFEPWNADPQTLAAAGVELGVTYPRPIVDHAAARDAALAAFASLRGDP